MNQKIKQLAEQATSIQGPTPYNPLTFEVFDKEKFAELIVRECIDTLQRSKDNFGSTDPQILKGARDALTISIYDIQNRFNMRED